MDAQVLIEITGDLFWHATRRVLIGYQNFSIRANIFFIILNSPKIKFWELVSTIYPKRKVDKLYLKKIFA